MTHGLRSSLEDLVEDGPPDLVPHDLARLAWSQGRRRRHRRQAVLAVLVLVLLGVGAGTVPLTHHAQIFAPAEGSGSATVGGYPERVGHQLWVPDLPSRPGPMAMLIERVVHRGSYDQPVGWEAVSESGHRWHIPGIFDNDTYPSLSPNGRYLAYLTGIRGPFVIHDLVTGQLTSFPSVGDALGGTGTPYQAQGQSPAFWSPDVQHLVMSGFSRNLVGRALVPGLDGSVELISGQPGSPAGWLDARTVVWLVPPSHAAKGPAQAEAQLTDLSGRYEGSIPLSAPMLPDTLHQWSGAVSPDGTEILVDQSGSTDTIQRFSLADGHQVGPTSNVDDLGMICTLAWTESTPVIPILDGDNVYPARLSATGVTRLVAIEPRLGTECVLWAGDALTGVSQPMMFGLSMSPWTWWWREICFGLLVVGSAIWILGRWSLVRRRRQS